MGFSPRIGLAVFLGGVAGTSLRFAVGELFAQWGLGVLGAIFIVNMAGALSLGWFGTRSQVSPRWSAPIVAFVSTGLLGSFTTFSAFSVETVVLLRSGAWLSASVYVLVSLSIGFAAAFGGRRMVSFK